MGSNYTKGLSSLSGAVAACSGWLPRLLGSAAGAQLLLVQAHQSQSRMKGVVVLPARDGSIQSPFCLSQVQLDRCFQTPFNSWCPQGLAIELMLLFCLSPLYAGRSCFDLLLSLQWGWEQPCFFLLAGGEGSSWIPVRAGICNAVPSGEAPAWAPSAVQSLARGKGHQNRPWLFSLCRRSS